MWSPSSKLTNYKSVIPLPEWMKGQSSVRVTEDQFRQRDVFLGGTCGATTWREDIAIPLLRFVATLFHINTVMVTKKRFLILFPKMCKSFILVHVFIGNKVYPTTIHNWLNGALITFQWKHQSRTIVRSCCMWYHL